MAVKISFGIQKGGVGKTTVTGITGWLLARDKKVLAVDFDSQGNLTQFLTRKNPYDFTGKTSLEACKQKDPRPCIVEVTENLHVIPANDFLSQFSKYIFMDYREEVEAKLRSGSPEVSPMALNLLLKETLDVVDAEYDYILIDLPPNLGEQTLNGMAASNYCVVMLQAEPFCKDALDRYLETMESIAEQVNNDVKLAGILTSMIDSRTSLGKYLLEQTRDEYEELVFNTVIRRKARVVEFTFEGISDRNSEDKEALDMYEKFVEELKMRVQG